MLRKTLFVSLLALAVSGLASAQAARYGALAVDEGKGFHFGFSHDHPSRATSEQAASEFCREHGGTSCSVVLSWAGTGCGAYQSLTTAGSDAYGWGLAQDQSAAESIASAELSKRTKGKSANNRVWACNANESGAFAVLKNERPKPASDEPLRFTDVDGDEYIYTGDLVDGKPHGSGQAEYEKDGSKYVGQFANGHLSGHGIFTWPSGSRFEGEFFNGQMVKGNLLFRNGDTYVGEIRDGKMHGVGRFTSASGEVWHDGLWSNHKPVN